jgi:hypothetical protein
MTSRIATIALVVACAAAAASAFAQGTSISPLEPPDTARYLRWGPFRVRPGFTIPTLGYDNNVYAVTDETAAADPGSKVGDYFVALSPRLEGLVLFGHWAFLTFDERLDFFLYAKQSGLDYFNQFGKARLTIPFRRVGLYWDTGYDRTRDRPYDAQNQRPIRKYYPFGLGLVTKFGWRTDSELGWFRNRYNAEDPNDPCDPAVNSSCFTVNDLNNRTEEGGRFKARYLAFGRTRVLLDLSQRTITFDDAEVGAQRDGTERRQLLGLDFGLGGRIFGTFRVGHAAFSLVDPAEEDFNGPVGDVALGYNFGSSGSRLTLTGARDVRYTTYDATPLYVYTGADLTLIKYFNHFVGMELSAGRANLDFLDSPSLDHRVDHDIIGAAGVRFRFSENQLGRRVEYAIRYTRFVINSTENQLDQNRGTFGFGMTVGY